MGIAGLVCLAAGLILAFLDRGTSVTAVAVHTDGSGELAGLYLTGGEPVEVLVITAHGGLASKETTLEFCREARARGADCLAVDLAGHGASASVAAHLTDRVSGASCSAMSAELTVLDRPSPLGVDGPTYGRRVFIGHPRLPKGIVG